MAIKNFKRVRLSLVCSVSHEGYSQRLYTGGGLYKGFFADPEILSHSLDEP